MMSTRLPIIVGGHTVDLERITGGLVLDAGCRNFHFSRVMRRLGCKVVALDADPTVEDPKIEGIGFLNYALADKPGQRSIVFTDNEEARHLAPEGVHWQGETAIVEALTIQQLSDMFAVEMWDVVKLDVEGSEYGILKAWPGPVAKQISVEFHEHCCPRPQAVYDEIFAHLGQWYDVVQHEKTAQHCCAPNFWDTLLTLREGL